MRISDLPDGECRGLVLHWSAGRYHQWFPHYHFSIMGSPQDGRIVNSHPVANNLRQLHPGDVYAAHTRRRNSWRIGLSVMAMYGATMANYGAYPPTPKQIETLCAVAALCVVKYGLIIYQQVRTHYEWAVTDGYYPNRWNFMREGPMLRGKVKWYAQRWQQIES